MIKTKYLVLLAVLPLFAGIMIGASTQFSLVIAAFAPDLIGDAYALQKAKGSSGLVPPHSFGAATAGIVCGDRLCSEATPVAPMQIRLVVQEDRMPDFMPSLGFKSLSMFDGDSSNTYAVEFTVTAAEKDLKSITIVCKTDVERIETVVSDLAALTTTTNVLRIKAMDPASITGEILSFQIARGAEQFPFDPVSKAPPGHQGAQTTPIVPEQEFRGVQPQEAEQPSLILKQQDLRDMSGDEPQVSTKKFVPGQPIDDAELFRVVYTILNVGGGDVQNVAIVVSSDVDTVTAVLQGSLETKRSTIAVMIKAFDYSSITAKIVSFGS